MQRLWIYPVYLVLRFWYMTLRVVMDEESQQVLNSRTKRPCVFYFWHHNLFAAPILRRLRDNRPMYGLMSASKDGAWLESLVKLFQVEAVRGSSTWRGALALKELEHCKQDCDIIITPDGPKGPRCVMKPGSVKWICKKEFNIITLKFEMQKVWKLNSWDQFHLPKPFSKIIVTAKLFTIDQSEEIASFVDRLQESL